jgi:hypothetical protein
MPKLSPGGSGGKAGPAAARKVEVVITRHPRALNSRATAQSNAPLAGPSATQETLQTTAPSTSSVFRKRSDTCRSLEPIRSANYCAIYQTCGSASRTLYVLLPKIIYRDRCVVTIMQIITFSTFRRRNPKKNTTGLSR